MYILISFPGEIILLSIYFNDNKKFKHIYIIIKTVM